MNNLIITNSESESESESDSEYSDINSDLSDENILSLNKEYTKSNEHFTDLYNTEFKTINILVDTYDFKKSPDFNTSNYVYHLNLTDYSSSNINSLLKNNTGGFDKYTNVIGFRLIKAVIPNIAYTINNNNNLFVYKIGNNIYEINLIKGYYTPSNLHNCIPNPNIHKITFIWIEGIWKYKINSTSDILICWDYNDKTRNLARLMGYYVNIDKEYNKIKYGNIVADFCLSYVDLVIDEIPSIACKQNSYGRRIIDRIPLDVCFGENKYYEPYHINNIDSSKFFYPITLDKLSIKLYSKNQEIFDNQDGNHTFEFELTIKN